MVFLKTKHLLIFSYILLVYSLSLFAGLETRATDSGYTIDIELQNLRIDTVLIEGQPFISIDASHCFVDGEPGEPAIPFMSFTTAARDKSSLKFELIEMNTMIIKGFPLKPLSILPPVGSEQQNAPPLPYNRETYPEQQISDGYRDVIFGVPVWRWEYAPVSFNAESNQIKIITRARIRINGNDLQKRVLPVNHNLSQKHYQILERRIHNYSYLKLTPEIQRSMNIKSSEYDLSTGPWLKIKIDYEGIYKLTYNQAQNAGFPVNDVNLAAVKLYSYQGELLPKSTLIPYNEGMMELAIKVIDNDGDNTWDSSDYLIFYGRGAHNFAYNENGRYFNYLENPYDDYNYFYLTASEGNGIRISSSPSLNVTPDSTLAQTLQLFHYEKSRQNILESGTEWYDRRFSGTSGSFDLSFSLEKPPLSTGDVRIQVGLKGGYGSFYTESTSSVFSVTYYFTASMNGTVILNNYNFRNNSSGAPVVSFPSALLSSSNELAISYSSTKSHGYAYFDYLDIQYYTANNLQDNHLKLFSPPATGNYAYSVNTTSAVNDILLLNVSDFSIPQEILPESSANGFQFIQNASDNIPDEFIITRISDIEDPLSVSEVIAEPNLRDTGNAADLIIITSDDFLSEARQLEALKESELPQYEPLDTEVITTRQIYREFSSGQLSPIAIRNFIKYSINHWAVAPQYILLLGDGHFDYKGIIYQNYNIVPPYEYEHPNEISARAIEAFFTDTEFNGSFFRIHPEIAIGRINVETSLEFDNYYEKLLRYLESYLYSPNYTGWQLDLTLVADDQFGETGYNSETVHIKEGSEKLISENHIPQSMNINKIYLTDYERAPGGIGRYKPGANNALIEQYNKGTALINFFGHGSPTTWAHESIFNIDRDLPKLRNSFRNPLVLAATCSFGQFDKPGYSAACEELLTAPEVGAIGVMAGNRATYSGSNETLVFGFFDGLFKYDQNTNITRTFGDAFLFAYDTSGGGTNTQKYLLMSDPTLKLCGSGYKIRIDSISADTLKALSKNQITASILNPDNSVNTDFNGTAVLTVFDVYSDPIYPFPEVLENYTFQHPGDPIFKGQYTISSGRIQGSFVIPKSIKYKDDPSARISIYAYSDANGPAIGYKDNLIVNGSIQGVSDSYGPLVDISFVENPGFIDGDVINTNATIQIAVEDTNGINITGESGHEIMLILDETQTFNITEFFLYQVDSYQKGIIEYPLTGLEGGLHQLTVKVWDNLNNLTVAETHFEVVAGTSDSDDLSLYHVVNVPNPMQDETHFTFSIINNEQSYADVTIKIFTIVGRMIRKIETTITENPNGYQRIYWDGRDDDGDHIANGVYVYKITVSNGDRKDSKIDKLMILK